MDVMITIILSMYYPLRLGLVCIVRELRPYGIYTGHTTRLAIAEREGLEYIYSKVRQNVAHLMTSLVYCEAHGIRLFRISSDLFPQWSNHRYSEAGYDLSQFREEFKQIGAFARDKGIRLTMHPDHNIKLSGVEDSIVQASLRDLEKHALIMEMLGHGPEDGSVFIVHGGGGYGDKEAALERWKRVYQSMDRKVSRFLCLENDEFTYSVTDLLPFCEENGIPFCLDFFHNRVSHDRVEITDSLLSRIVDTWKDHGGIPKFHYSVQEPDARRGTHSQSVHRLPKEILHLPRRLRTPVDIMLETKDKDISIHHLHYKYYETVIDSSGRQEHILLEEYR